MTYDVAHRFAHALDPSALSTITATLPAIEAARRNCRGARRNGEKDAAVLLLARHRAAREAAPGALGPERVVFEGGREPRRYTNDEDGCVVLHLSALAALRSLEAVRA